MAQLGNTNVTGQIAVSGAPSDPTHVVRNNDTRLSDTRTPKIHGPTHATGEPDALAPGDIGAASEADFTAHAEAQNPHGTNAEDVGLGNLVNGLQLQADQNLADLPDAAVARINLGLGSGATRVAGEAGGVATLDDAGKVPQTQLPVKSAAYLEAGTPGGAATLGDDGKVPAAQLPAGQNLGSAALLEAGVSGGVATLGDDGKVPPDQLPENQNIGTAASKNVGEPLGVAGLDADGKVPVTQLPVKSAAYLEAGSANGAATLGPDGKLKSTQMPSQGTFGSAAALNAGVANGVATLDENGKIPAAQMPQVSVNLGTSSGKDVGVPGGVAGLDGDGTVPMAQLPAAVKKGWVYQGTWNAASNAPQIPAAASGNTGWIYNVSVSGTTLIDGNSRWLVGDWIVSDGAVWRRVLGSEALKSVNGQTGDVVLQPSDIGAATAEQGAKADSALQSVRVSDIQDATGDGKALLTSSLAQQRTLLGVTAALKLKVISATYVSVAGDCLASDTSAAGFTLFLPATPANGDVVELLDFSKSWGTHPLIVDGNGAAIETGTALTCNVSNPMHLLFVWRAATARWQVFGY